MSKKIFFKILAIVLSIACASTSSAVPPGGIALEHPLYLFKPGNLFTLPHAQKSGGFYSPLWYAPGGYYIPLVIEDTGNFLKNMR